MEQAATDRGTAYQTRPAWLLWLAFIAAAFAVPVAGYFGYLATLNEYYAHGTARGTETAYLFAVIVFLITAIFIGLLIGLLARKRTRVTLFQDRLEVVRPNARWDIRYAHIDEIYLEETRVGFLFFAGRKAGCTLRTGSGAITLRSDIGGFSRMVKALEDAIFPRVYSRAKMELADGRNAGFGPVAVNLQGLTLAGRVIAWKDCISHQVSAGSLVFTILQQGKPVNHQIPVRTIPNLAVLLKLLQEFSVPSE